MEPGAALRARWCTLRICLCQPSALLHALRLCSLQHYLGVGEAQLHECAACGPLRRDVTLLNGLWPEGGTAR
eukprot:8532523-Lingulodinium_polyedra.AAC.1